MTSFDDVVESVLIDDAKGGGAFQVSHIPRKEAVQPGVHAVDAVFVAVDATVRARDGYKGG